MEVRLKRFDADRILGSSRRFRRSSPLKLPKNLAQFPFQGVEVTIARGRRRDQARKEVANTLMKMLKNLLYKLSAVGNVLQPIGLPIPVIVRRRLRQFQNCIDFTVRYKRCRERW